MLSTRLVTTITLIQYIYYDILKKLPDREYFSGLPEIVKCGLLKKNKILKILLNSKKKFCKEIIKFLKIYALKSLKTKKIFFLKMIFMKMVVGYI